MNNQLDHIDEAIISLLRSDGRTSNAEIARRIGVSEGTIRNRLARLIDDDFVRIVAVTNHYKLGYHIDTFVAIDADIDKITDVANRLSEMDEVRYVSIATGIYSLICAVSFKSQEDIYRFITEKLAPIPGVRKADTAHVLRVVKRAFDWVIPD